MSKLESNQKIYLNLIFFRMRIMKNYLIIDFVLFPFWADESQNFCGSVDDVILLNGHRTVRQL
jgi:hypothetical protein